MISNVRLGDLGLDPRARGAENANVKPRRRRARVARTVLAGASIGLVVLLLSARHNTGTAVVALENANLRWLAVAVAAKALSMLSFSALHRGLLGQTGNRVRRRRALGVALAANAISMTLPVGGSATGAAYTLRAWVKRGVQPAAAAWEMLVGGIYSMSMFALLIGVGGATSRQPSAVAVSASLVLLAITAMLCLLAAVRSPFGRDRLKGLAKPLIWIVARLTRTEKATQRAQLDEALSALSSYRQDSAAVPGLAGLALATWTLDVGCLALCMTALHVNLPWTQLVLIYLAGIGVANLGLTPAGLGIVEVSMAATATALGMSVGDALASAVLYRAISCWLTVAIGWILVFWFRRHPPRASLSVG